MGWGGWDLRNPCGGIPNLRIPSAGTVAFVCESDVRILFCVSLESNAQYFDATRWYSNVRSALGGGSYSEPLAGTFLVSDRTRPH